MALTQAGEIAVAACSDGHLRLYKAGTGEALREIIAHEGSTTNVIAFPDGKRIASVGTDGKLRIFSVAAGEKQGEWALSTMPLRAVAVDPAGEYLACAGDDGVVRVLTLAGGALREMPGHDGSVRALVFTPRDGRLISGGDDGLLRIWFLVGDIECETRGENDGHKGTVHGLFFLPQPKAKAGTEDPGDRFVSIGSDGKAKFWRLEDRRKPRTIEVQGGNLAAFALTFAKVSKGDQFGLLFIGGDLREIDQISIDAIGVPGASTQLGHGFTAQQETLFSSAKAAQENAVRELAPIEEREALDLLIRSLDGGRFPEVQELIARELGKHRRIKAREALRSALNSNHITVRHAAYEALLQIDGEISLTPARNALKSKHPDLRIRAIQDLASKHATSPLTTSLLAAQMSDSAPLVRVAALDAYTTLVEQESVEPLQVAFNLGPVELKSEVVIRAALQKQLAHPQLVPLLTLALDDADAKIRQTTFVVLVLARPALAAHLEKQDENFRIAVKEISYNAAIIQASFASRQGNRTPSEQEQLLARKALGNTIEESLSLTEEDLAPLLTAMACRTPDTALRGARGLADLGDLRALGALLQLTREPDKQIRCRTAAALQALKDPRAKKRLVWMLDDTDADVRSAAYEAYERLETNPNELAESALRSAQKDIRVRGLNLLVKQSNKQSATSQALLEDALEDESAEVRNEAFRTLWAQHNKTPEQALPRVMKARFPDLRKKAVLELETLGKDHNATWARESLISAIRDRDEAVAQAAFDATIKLLGKEDTTAPLAAMTTHHGKLRAAGAKACHTSGIERTRSALMKQLHDENPEARAEALTTLDKLLPREAGPLYAALQGSFYDLKILAAEFLAERRDEQLIDTMRGFLSDKEILYKLPTNQQGVLASLRFRAAKSLATLGTPRLLSYFSTDLLQDESGDIREQAARGLSLACRKGDETYLLDALGHKDVAVRSWAAEGLAKLGDVRALPVLTGHLRHEHPPVRLGAILSFAALGPEGYGGMLQGLEDTAQEVQELVFLIVMARDLRAFRAGEPPDLLTSALSSQRAEVRYAAARALELRGEPERYLSHLIEALLPPKPEKASAMKDWPSEENRSRLMVRLAENIASDSPEIRYASAQSLRLRTRPTDYFKQVEKLTKVRSATKPTLADTTPRSSEEDSVWGAKGWLRRLFKETETGVANDVVPDAEQQRLRWLAFGAYVGLLRQTVGSDETRVRRDAIDRIADLVQQRAVSATAAIPPLRRALDDSNHLVRRAAFTGLKRLFPEGAEEPLSLALGSRFEDMACAALDELAARGATSREPIRKALNAPLAEVRKYALTLLEGLYPKGSLEPLFHALQSDHADTRLGVIQRLATTQDERVPGALSKALRSDHDDLRLLAAELLASRKSDLPIDVLATFLRGEERHARERATTALALIASTTAIEALTSFLFEETDAGTRIKIIEALARTRNEAALQPLLLCLSEENSEIRQAAFDQAFSLSKINSHQRNWKLALQVLQAASQTRDPELRRLAAFESKEGEDVGQNTLLRLLLLDREVEVRKAAVSSYAFRVSKKGAPIEPLEEVIHKGARETLLAAAEGVAERGGTSALRPLLLFARAGESDERPRAILALGTLGDARALAELEQIASGGTEEAPVEPTMRTAGIEALGRIHDKLTDQEAKKRILEGLENTLNDSDQATLEASLRGLRWIAGERARSRIEATLVDKSTFWRTQLIAVELLAERKEVESEVPLLISLKEGVSDVVSAAYKALCRIFPTERERVELHALMVDDPEISSKAAQFLVKEGDPEKIIPKLAELSDASLFHQLHFGLSRRPSLPEASLNRLLAHTKASPRKSAAWLLAIRAGTPLSSEQIQALLEAEKNTAKFWGECTLKERENEEETWLTILWALRSRNVVEALPRYRQLVTADPKVAPEAVRKAALGVLQTFTLGSEDKKTIQTALQDPSPTMRSIAAASLQRHAPESALETMLQVEPSDPISFASARPAPTTKALSIHEGRSLVLAKLIQKQDTSQVVPMLEKAKEQDLLDLISVASHGGTDEVLEPLRKIAFDKKNYKEAERKAAYRALRQAQRRIHRKQQETQA